MKSVCKLLLILFISILLIALTCFVIVKGMQTQPVVQEEKQDLVQQGYVFGGYLEESVENIDCIRALEGKYVYNTGYIDDYDDKTLTVKYKGGNYFFFYFKISLLSITIIKETIELEKNPVLTEKFEVTATEETISNYYVMFGDLKKRVYDVVQTNMGTTVG